MELLLTPCSANFQRYVANTRGGQVTFDLPARYTPCYSTTSDGTSQIVVLGGGAFGVVIKCSDSVRKEDVAVKKLLNPFQNELFARRTYREFALMRRLPQHHNVIHLLDAFTTAQSLKDFASYYVVMEYMDYDLSQFWHGVQAKQVPHINLSYLLYQMLCAVNHLHRIGIIHRDLKPQNLAVRLAGCQLRLLDFGLARAFISLKMSNYVYTRWYRAPEVVLEAEYTTKADIWAIGCIFAEILLGGIYLKGKNHVDQWVKIAERFGMPDDSFLAKVQPEVVGIIKTITPTTAKPVPFDVQFPESIFPPDDAERPEKFCAAQARDLLSKLLTLDPDKRFSAEQVLTHPYVEAWFDPEDVTGELPPFDYDAEPAESTPEHWKQSLWTEITNYMMESQRNNENAMR